ncbi:MAG: lipase maturation factor family protein [Acidobacteria bacterium]|nr:lipase maturation factor family protein [Acidobacteriota bacterium]
MPAPERPRFALSRALFLRLLGVVYGVAFLSLAPQLPGLVGSEGLLPAAAYLERVYEVQGAEAYYRLPTLLWLWPGDALLLGLCWAGIVLSAAAVAGLAPIATFAALWLCYLSLTVAGQDFLSFQWDVLLLEAGLLAVVYAPAGRRIGLGSAPEPGVAARWLVWGLAFKLTFLSGITKLLSGDETWWGLTALRYHYETQPIPTWVGWYAHQAPAWIATLSTAVMFAIELGAPFVILLPSRFRRVRLTGFALLCLLQALIAATGNYGFFNLLTVVLYLSLLDDATLGRFLPGLGAHRLEPPPARGNSLSRRAVPSRWRRAAVGVVASALAAASAYTFVREIRRPEPMPEWSAAAFGWVAPFRSVNGYGLFRTMTVERPEIVVEGSADGITWTEYPFRWKAGDPNRAPGFVQPHMPRLDWQMWFAALGPRAEAHWLLPLAGHLLDPPPAVLALLDDDNNPFADEPPRFVRLALYDYRFTTLAEGTGDAWWRRELIAYLTEPIARGDLR